MKKKSFNQTIKYQSIKIKSQHKDLMGVFVFEDKCASKSATLNSIEASRPRLYILSGVLRGNAHPGSSLSIHRSYKVNSLIKIIIWIEFQYYCARFSSQEICQS